MRAAFEARNGRGAPWKICCPAPFASVEVHPQAETGEDLAVNHCVHIGQGYYTRANTEFCILAARVLTLDISERIDAAANDRVQCVIIRRLRRVLLLKFRPPKLSAVLEEI